MTGIPLPAWVSLGIVFAAIIFIVVLVAKQLVAARIEAAKWKSLQAMFPFQYQASGPIDEQTLIFAMNRAFEALSFHGPWQRSTVWAVCSGVKVLIHSEESWNALICDNQGKCVAGNASGQSYPESRMVVTNASLASLCHELAHVVEFSIDHAVDYEHSTWQMRGIAAADAEYLKT